MKPSIWKAFAAPPSATPEQAGAARPGVSLSAGLTLVVCCCPNLSHPCSVGNQPRVLPAVVRYLSDARYQFDSEEDNPGVINVMIGC